MLKIWGRNNSVNVQKVMWAVGEIGIQHERIDAGGAFGRNKDPDYLKMNPNGLVPVLQDGDVTLWESNIIVRYLAARYGDDSLWPEDPVVRAETDKWMDWMITTINPAIFPTFWGLIRTPPEQRDMGKWRVRRIDLAHDGPLRREATAQPRRVGVAPPTAATTCRARVPSRAPSSPASPPRPSSTGADRARDRRDPGAPERCSHARWT